MPGGYGLSRSSQPRQSLLSTFRKRTAEGATKTPRLSKPVVSSKKQMKVPDELAPPLSTDEEDNDDDHAAAAPANAAVGIGTGLNLLAYSSGDEEVTRGTISKTTWTSSQPSRSPRKKEDISDSDHSVSSSASKKRKKGTESEKTKRQKVVPDEDQKNSSQDLPTSSASQSTKTALFGRRHANVQTFGKKWSDASKNRIRQPKRAQWHQSKHVNDAFSDSEGSAADVPSKTVTGSPGATGGKSKRKGSQRGLKVAEDIDSDLFDSPQKKPGKLKVRQRAGTDELLSSPPRTALRESTSNTRDPSRRKGKKGKAVIKSPGPEPVPPKPTFKAPALIDDSFDGGACGAATGNGDLTPWWSDTENSDDPQRLSPVLESPASPTPAKCPWCTEPVSAVLLADYSKGKKRLTVNMQRKFCQMHKKSDAIQDWKDKGYPEIAWDILPARLDDHQAHLLSVVNGERPSVFRSALAQQIRDGKSRALREDDNLNPGYYGARGFQLMCDYLVDTFRDALKQRAVEDPVISGRGSAAFIQSVLLPELGVRLIMEDMDVGEEAARHMLEDSKAVGELVSEEV